MAKSHKIDRLSWRLGLSIALLVVSGQAAGFYLVYRHSYEQLLRTTRAHAAVETWLIQQALEHQMLTKDDRLLRRMVDEFARDLSFERVMILDREGVVRFSSDPEIRARHFSFDSPTCKVCHQDDSAVRANSTVLDIDGGNVLRVVQPIFNRATCHDCHDASQRINGLVIADVPLEESMAELERSIAGLIVGTGLIGLLLLSSISLVFRRLVMRRLFRFESAARALAHGDLDRRVPVDGDDALARVENQFNEMADSLGGLLTELRDQRANLERVMNSVDDGMVVLDADRKIVAANDAFWRRFPGTGPDSIGRCCCSGDGVGCDGEGDCPTLQSFASTEPRTAVRSRRLADGSRRLEEVLASPVVADGKRVTHVVEVWRDITERRTAEAKLAEQQRMVSLGRLASGFSHEVNTPLASIGTCLDAITRVCKTVDAVAGKEKEMIEEYAHVASTQVQRCGTITEQFLQLARGRALSREAIDLRSVAVSSARLCWQIAAEAGVKVVVGELDDLPSVVGNPAAVQQVLLNLLMNAIEASAAGGDVEITFRAERGVEMCVRDGGHGISPEDRERLFEPFFTKRNAGTGLGLFVSLSLARSWGGDIIGENNPGGGARFTVTFPDGEAGANDG